ncbi:MAG TPA: hypothetical protein EYG38_17135 [Verrucomicrobia bacterium]|nr:hypothetical protein [Verrucomicrobiota bacterium]
MKSIQKSWIFRYERTFLRWSSSNHRAVNIRLGIGQSTEKSGRIYQSIQFMRQKSDRYPRCSQGFFRAPFVLLLLSGVFISPYSQAQDSSRIAPGFKLETFARPPEATYPVSVAASPEGAVFVSVDLNSSLDRKPDRGKIIRCEDTDGDGVADRYTDFVPNIDSPRGLCFVGETLYVVHPPFLTSFKDLDGDGIADERDTLITGLGFDLSFRGADHTSNGVRMGIDGWLYLAIGDYGFLKAVAKDGSSFHLHGGGVLRIRPDGTELEPYALYTRNIYDVAMSPTLDLFSRDNTNDGKGWDTRLHHFIAFANHGYPRLYKNFPNEHLQPLADYGGGSGTGAYFMDEPGFPEAFNDKLYTCDFTTQHVYVHSVERQEATFRAGQESFYAIKAIDMDVDGSSAIYVCDWVRGGYTYKNPSVGSISRITYPGLKPAVYPSLKKSDNQELLKHLISNSAVLRINAQQEILKRGPDPVFRRGLVQVVSDSSNLLYGRIAALFTYKQLYWVHAQNDLLAWVENDDLREYALRALADRQSETALVPSEPFVTGLKDPNPRVRLQSIIGLARMDRVEHASAILPLAVDSSGPLSEDIQQRYQNNRAIPHIALKALVHLKASKACLNALADPGLQQTALRCLQEMHSSRVVNGLIRKLNNAQNPELNAGILNALFRLYHVDKKWDAKKWWTTRPDDRGPYFTPIPWEMSPTIHRAIEANFGEADPSHHSDLFVSMRRNRLDP